MAGLFPKWMNGLPTLGAIAGLGALVGVAAGGWYWLTPDFFEVGYMPTQPGNGFNHQIHAGTLGLDCRYCHTHVEDSSFSNVPSVATCYGCHSEGKIPDTTVKPEKVQFIRTAYADKDSIQWRKIHIVPDYAHFPHNVHVNAGVSCFSCHGQIRGMPVVHQDKSLAMGWCLDCHRNPEKNLVPPEKVADLIWAEDWFSKPVEERVYEGQTPAMLVETLKNNPPQHCAACHY